MLAILTTLTLGKNPLKQTASPSALQALVKTQRSRLGIPLSPPKTENEHTDRRHQWAGSISESTLPTVKSPPPPPGTLQPHLLHSTDSTVGATVISESGKASGSGDTFSGGGADCGESNIVGHGIVDNEMAIGVAGADCKKDVCNGSVDGAQYDADANVPGFEVAVLSGGRGGSSSRGGGAGEGEEEEDGESMAAGLSEDCGGLDSPGAAAAFDHPLRRLTSETATDLINNPGRWNTRAREHNHALLVPSTSGGVALDTSAVASPASEAATPVEISDSLTSVSACSKSATRSAEAAFERLADARERAAGSSWGGVALAGSGFDKPEVGNTWAASALAAKLVCNGMVSLRIHFFILLSFRRPCVWCLVRYIVLRMVGYLHRIVK